MDARRKKLLFRANHRGFKEMDLIMGHFAEANLEFMTDVQLDQCEALMDAPDQDVYAWIVGTGDIPETYQGDVLEQLRAFDVSTILQNPG